MPASNVTKHNKQTGPSRSIWRTSRPKSASLIT